ncbi:hypothetical protein FNJ87_12145 [Nonlabens mediterrranea]|uniref:Lipocalin-like domain-containing protein n=1 Tax=Nonlabens mediterrranea TaxID=1419947 RepID=A0ABS0A6N8_9FLAO|nr:hypothetical protein [Nonlabens mediterrranea]
MKKLFVILISVLALTSCETEALDPGLNPSTGGTGSGNVDAALLVGDWLYTDVETNTTTTTTVSGTPVSITASVDFVSSNAIMTFNVDGTYAITGDLEFEVINQGVSQGNQTNTFNDVGTYTVTGDILTLNSASPNNVTPFDDTTTLTITTLNSTDLSIDINGLSTQTAGGGSIEILIDGFADFVRQ